MDKAIWDGRVYDAFDVAESYELEKQVRIASAGRKLRCPDPQCEFPCVKYCHGEIKEPFFAHIDKNGCDYSEYDAKTPSALKLIKRLVHDSFKRRGYNVEMDVKILPHHYTHLAVSFGERRVAIELANKNTSAAKLESLRERYKKINMSFVWLVVGYPEEEIDEKNVFFAKRYMLNETELNDLIIIDEDGMELSQYRPDINRYEYNGSELKSQNYPTVFKMNFDLDDLIVDEKGYFGFRGFSVAFEEMLQRKQRAFTKRIEELERTAQEALEAEEARLKRIREQQAERLRVAEERKRKEAEEKARLEESRRVAALKRRTEIEENSDVTIKKVGEIEQITIQTNSMENKEEKDLYYSLFFKENTCIYNREGMRLFMCRRCYWIGFNNEFSRIGLSGRRAFSIGLCNSCDNYYKKEKNKENYS